MTVKEQLEEYCDCVDVEEKDVFELVSLISAFTCWTGKVCDTFLSAERKEVIDIPDCVCRCDVFEFEPFYTPFDPDSFSFTLIEQDGIKETATELKDFIYSGTDENFKIELPLESCDCRDLCGCTTNYKLLVNYTAGYEEIPECLLPVFCEALQWIKEKNTCDCSECKPCQDDDVRKYYEIDLTTMTGRIQDYFLTVLTKQYFNLLSQISLCQHRDIYKLWGVVV